MNAHSPPQGPETPTVKAIRTTIRTTQETPHG